MSKDLIVAVIQRYNGRPTREKMLACVLAEHANGDGRNIYPSVERMAALTNQSIRTVQVQLGAMLRLKWLQPLKWESGPRSCPIYRINPAWILGTDLWELAASPVDKFLLEDERGARRGAKGVHSTAKRGASYDATNKAQRTEIPPNGSTSSEPCEASFHELVAVYPKMRVDFAAAQHVWQRAMLSGELANRVVTAARTMARSMAWQKEDGRFAPKLSKWLRDQGWLDPAAAHTEPSRTSTCPSRALTAEELSRNRENAAKTLGPLRESFGSRRFIADPCNASPGARRSERASMRPAIPAKEVVSCEASAQECSSSRETSTPATS
jgi:hypothetical protein